MGTDRVLSASFLLCLWQVEMNGDRVWRLSLEGSQTGERWGFADLEALFDFLRRRTAPQMTGDAGAAPPTKAPTSPTTRVGLKPSSTGAS
jgi:hypothetical protein